MPESCPPGVDHSSWMDPPHNRWSLQHLDAIVPVVPVSRGGEAVSSLEYAERDLQSLTYRRRDHEQEQLGEMLSSVCADAFLVMHRGKVITEAYFNKQHAGTRHCLFSLSKSVAGLIIALLIEEGKIDAAAAVPAYLPELADSAYAHASVQSLLNMTVALASREPDEVADINDSEVYQHMVAANYLPLTGDYHGPATLSGFLASLRSAGAHDESFSYQTPNTEVLVQIAERVTGRPMSTVVSERLWRPLGMADDGYVLSSREGTESWGGGFCATARDMARLGQMLLQSGCAEGGQVLSGSVVDALFAGGDRELFARSEEGGPDGLMRGWSYVNQWWVPPTANPVIAAIGMHGQWLYVDKAADMVIVLMASYPETRNDYLEGDVPRCFEAIAEYLGVTA